MGSKISVVIILVVMLVLVGVVTDSDALQSGNNTPAELQTYEEVEEAKLTSTPDFEDFNITEHYQGAVASVSYEQTPLTTAYASIIDQHIEAVGVNFAGKYNIATWSCGEECQHSVIVNIETGDIVAYGIMSAYGLAYSPDSRLLIINPEGIVEDENTSVSVVTDYNVLNDDEELLLVSKEVGNRSVFDDCIDATTTARNLLTNETDVFTTPCQVPFGWEIIGNNETEN